MDQLLCSLDGYHLGNLAVYGFPVDGAFSICTSTPPPAGLSRISTPLKNQFQVQDSLNWVANDVIVASPQFMMQTMTFEAVAINGEPTSLT